jgi:ATP-dependent 26S proteasome regulatory subunit
VITYALPNAEVAKGILEARLALYSTDNVSWDDVLQNISGLSQAELSRAADEAAKVAVLGEHNVVTTTALVTALNERKKAVL